MNAKERATALHAELVRARGFCERCGSPRDLTCAHIIRRRYGATRTDLSNAWCLCLRCHRLVDTDGEVFLDLIEATIGHHRHMALYRKAQEVTHMDWHAELEILKALR